MNGAAATSRLTCGSFSFDLRRTLVMGIVNVTPDSFSDGGQYCDVARAVARGRQLVAEGADLLDIGGESTRPGSDPVTVAEELRRVVPVIAALAGELAVPLSVDTYKAEVAQNALAAGACIVNDISAGTFDAALLPTAARHGAAVVLMHTGGPPKTMQTVYRYDDVVAEVVAFLAARVQTALQLGIDRSRIVVDPGIGFGKGLEHNIALLQQAGRFAESGCAVMVGPSRKSFLGQLTDRDVAQREFATAAAVTVAVLAGAHVVRVHNVAAMRDVVRVADACKATGRS